MTRRGGWDRPGEVTAAWGGDSSPGDPPVPPQLPNFFLKIPDYALYAPDVEFQCHLLHLHTRWVTLGTPRHGGVTALAPRGGDGAAATPR